MRKTNSCLKPSVKVLFESHRHYPNLCTIFTCVIHWFYKTYTQIVTISENKCIKCLLLTSYLDFE